MARLFSDEDLATAAIWAEARGESADGKTAVAEVIRNRTRALYQSNGFLPSTLFRPYQFSAFNTDTPWRHQIFELGDRDISVADCRDAWRRAQAGSNLTGGAVLYHATNIPKPRWASEEGVTPTVTIGHHIFYRDSTAQI